MSKVKRVGDDVYELAVEYCTDARLLSPKIRAKELALQIQQTINDYIEEQWATVNDRS